VMCGAACALQAAAGCSLQGAGCSAHHVSRDADRLIPVAGHEARTPGGRRAQAPWPTPSRRAPEHL